MSGRQLGVAIDDSVLKEQRQAINENVEDMPRSHHKRLIKRKRGKDKDDQEGGTNFMIATVSAVLEVCVVEGYMERERAEA